MRDKHATPYDHTNMCIDCKKTGYGKSCPYIKSKHYPDGSKTNSYGKLTYCPEFIPEWVKVNLAFITRIIGVSIKLINQDWCDCAWIVEKAREKGVTIRYSWTMHLPKGQNYPQFFMKVTK